MNNIIIKGSTKERRHVALKTTQWFLRKFLPRFKTLEIEIKLNDCYKKSKTYGYCLAIDDKHREFEIQVDKSLRLFDFTATLCHELIHLKQYARFEMRDIGLNEIKWKKTIFKNKDYNTAPWENEAYRFESKLAKMCFEEVL